MTQASRWLLKSLHNKSTVFFCATLGKNGKGFRSQPFGSHEEGIDAAVQWCYAKSDDGYDVYHAIANFAEPWCTERRNDGTTYQR
jgi:hypothetical protein